MINISKNVIGYIVLVLSFSYSSFAQTLPNIQDKFESYSRNTLQEKLFVHTDRGTYFTGEILWFKIYAVDGVFNKPLNFSKVVYVDVLDDKQNAVLQAKISLDNGSGSGSLFVPVTINNGNYKLRAYTSWMKNFSPGYYFEKTITIINPQLIPEASTAKNTAVFDMQFFPEGGNLVSGIQSKVAFKAAGPDGKGIDFKGAVIDQKNDTIIRFAPLKFGMGHFLFTPAGNSTYRAVITVANNKPVIKQLPAIAGQGYVMQLTDNVPGQLDVSVSSNGNPSDKVYIFVHTRQIVKVAKEANLNNGLTHFLIDKSSLDEGISHITIFNSARQPVCERLYFKRPPGKLFISANLDQQQYSCRKKVNIQVEAKNQSGNPLNANLSMSVYRLDGLQNADQGDILSYLWLSSDLQGSIESPGYYFTNESGANEAVDNLMLTQGWRRFEWTNILNDKPAVFNFLPETYGHIITGKIVNIAANTPANGVITYLGVPGKRVQLFPAKSDSTGRLLFNTKDLYGGEIIVQPNTLLDSTYRIDILSPFSEQYSQTRLPAFTIKPDMPEAFEARNVEMQVQNIYAGDRTKQFDEPLTDSSGFYEKPVNSYLLDNYTRFTTMEEVLREYVSEVILQRRQGKFHIRLNGEQSFLDDPLVLIDGIPVFDADKLIAVDPLKIKKLEVVPQRYFYGPASMEGILSFTSYKGDLAGLEIDPHAIVVDYEGLQTQRVFYSPVYEKEGQIKSRLPDFRNLLFWAPKVNPNTKNAVSFYTSDREGEYIGIVQGLTANGEAGSHYFTFTVKK